LVFVVSVMWASGVINQVWVLVGSMFKWWCARGLTVFCFPPIMSAKVEEVVSSSSDEDTDDEMPELESADAGNADAGAAASGKQNRAEKKSRKAILKLGLKPVSGIKRVTIKKSKNVRMLLQEVGMSLT
jgi:hypothetical protein